MNGGDNFRFDGKCSFDFNVFYFKSYYSSAFEKLNLGTVTHVHTELDKGSQIRSLLRTTTTTTQFENEMKLIAIQIFLTRFLPSYMKFIYESPQNFEIILPS